MKKPFETYNGGKAGNGTYQQIINHIPKCDVFIDAMVGGGGIFFNLALPGNTVINDVDRNVIAKYNDISCISGIVVKNECYSDIIKKYDGSKRTFFYFDPPYHLETVRSEKPLYKYVWNHSQHEDFLKKIKSMNSLVMVSHYPCALYDSELSSWSAYDFESITRNGMRTERIYMNYPKPHILQDFRYLGNDYRERQGIKRKINRWINRLDRLPANERTGILSSIIVKYSDTAANLLVPADNAKNNDEDHTVRNNDKILNENFDQPPSEKALLAMETFLINQ